MPALLRCLVERMQKDALGRGGIGRERIGPGYHAGTQFLRHRSDLGILGGNEGRITEARVARRRDRVGEKRLFPQRTDVFARGPLRASTRRYYRHEIAAHGGPPRA